MDYGLTSVSQAIDLVRKAQQVLQTNDEMLHKIVSNIPEVMNSFPVEDLKKNLRIINILSDKLPLQASLLSLEIVKDLNSPRMYTQNSN